MSASHHRIQRFFELALQVDILVDREGGALFCLIEAARSARNNNKRDIGRFRLAFQGINQFVPRHLWHIHVGNDQIWMHPLEDLQGFNRPFLQWHRETIYNSA